MLVRFNSIFCETNCNFSSLVQMPRVKCPSKRSKLNIEAAEGSSSGRNILLGSPEFARFIGHEQRKRWNLIKQWSWIKERRVELAKNEFPDFANEIERRK